jgi:hypothetical protein
LDGTWIDVTDSPRSERTVHLSFERRVAREGLGIRKPINTETHQQNGAQRRGERRPGRPSFGVSRERVDGRLWNAL